MAGLVQTLLRNPGDGLALALSRQVALPRTRMLVAGLCGAMAWGAAMGSHVGRAHVWITTIKMPLMLLGTLTLCFPLMQLTVAVARLPLRSHQTLTIALGGVAVFATCLGALAPVLALFAATAPIPSMASYLNLYLLCAACGVGAGLYSLRALVYGLRAAAPGTKTGWVIAAWALLYQFTGAQAAWVLRPWIGSSYGVDGYWNLQRGLSGNFYLGVGRVFLRWLAEIGVLS